MERKITDINNPPFEREITKIEMSLNSRSYLVGILVESPNNEKLFSKLFSKECRFFPTNGKQRLVSFLENLNHKSNFKIIGIIDADFSRIENKVLTMPNLFMTDYHDTEMMMIFSEAWNNVMTLANKEKLEDFEASKKQNFRDFLLKLCKELALIRLLNERENLGLTFKTEKKGGFDYLDYTKFIDEKNLNFNFEGLLKAVENKSNKNFFFNKNPEYRQKLEILLQENFDLKELCNGHDFLNILSIAFEKVIGTEKISANSLETHFIVAYRLTDFQESQLFETLQSYQNQKKLSILKPL